MVARWHTGFRIVAFMHLFAQLLLWACILLLLVLKLSVGRLGASAVGPWGAIGRSMDAKKHKK